MDLEMEGPRPFEHDFPTPRAAKDIYDQQDLQRAVEAYRFFYPCVSMEAIFHGNREAGVEDGQGFILVAAAPQHLIFTSNSDTPYAAAVLDLERTGPVVIDMPAGAYVGLVDDHYHRWVLDLGLPGPDAGEGGKYLVLPPNHSEDAPRGYHVGRSPTFKALVALRAIPGEHGVDGALAALREVRVYPLADPKALMSYVDVTQRSIDTTPLRWEGNLEFWKRLHAVLGLEPVLEEDRPMAGVLAALGIERQRPFEPDARMQRILEHAAKTGLAQMRIEGFASLRDDSLVWPDRQWEWAGLSTNPNFENDSFIDLQARDRWFVQAIATSPAIFRREPGGGSLYFLAARERGGTYLDGGKAYRLCVPHPVPAKLFWSVTAYDAGTRTQVRTPQQKAVLGLLADRFEPNADGSVDVYFGPEPPESRAGQWIQTSPGRGFFLYLRLYGPQAAAFDGSWRPSDVTRLEAPQRAETPPEQLERFSTPDEVQSRIGLLTFTDGVPSPEAAAKVYDQLDFMDGVEAFQNAMAAVSMASIHNGLLDAGVKDHDVLLFSGLTDSRSLLLTANCDTVYFFSFLDLAKGPVVVEMPPKTLGMFNDMWFRWLGDAGVSGPDRGEGGRYLVVPRGISGPLPDGGYTIVTSRTRRVALIGRAFLEDDDPAPAVRRIEQHLKIFPYVPGGHGTSIASFLEGRAPFAARLVEPPPPRFVEGTGLAINALPPNDFSFYEILAAAVQEERVAALDPEIAGQLAAIGIVKGKPFKPDARMRKILGEAVIAGNAAARTVGLRPRPEEGFGYYGEKSAWGNPFFKSGYDFMGPPPLITERGVRPMATSGARALHARTAFFYLAFAVTPAMCMRLPGIGSQYLAAFADAEARPFDGAKTYALTLPPKIPAATFWSLTLYDNQTRSMLQTEQRFPRAGSQGYPTPAAVPDTDGSTTLYFGAEPPDGVEPGNWIQTTPGKGWFVLLRLYGPLEPFFDKSWRPGEIREVR